MSVETDAGLIRDPRHDVERDGTVVRASGVVPGTTGCSAVAYSGAVGGPQSAEIDLSTVADGVICTQVMTNVRYDLVVDFATAPPSDLSVRVSDRAIDPPLVRSASFEAADGDDEEDALYDVDRDPALDRATVSGTVRAPDACTGFQYAGTERNGDAATVVLESFSTGQACALAVTPVDYELVVEFPEGLPRTIDVAVR